MGPVLGDSQELFGEHRSVLVWVLWGSRANLVILPSAYLGETERVRVVIGEGAVLSWGHQERG